MVHRWCNNSLLDNLDRLDKTNLESQRPAPISMCKSRAGLLESKSKKQFTWAVVSAK